MEQVTLLQYISLIMAIVSIIGSAISAGVVFGSLKGKVNELSNLLNGRKKYNDNSIDDISNNISYLYSKTSELDEKEHELRKYVDNKFEVNRNYIDSSLKDVNNGIRNIQETCAARKSKIDLITNLNEKVKQLEIDVGVLPSKLSKELSRAFSEEYKNLFTTLSDKNKQ